MAKAVDRRFVLRASLTTAAAAGLAGAAATPATAAVSGTAAAQYPKATEFWYQYDELTWYNPPPDMTDAYAAIEAALGSIEDGFFQMWRDHRAAGTFPHAYLDAVRPTRDALAVIARHDKQIFDEFWGTDPAGLVTAFVDFGQGILFDDRRGPRAMVHMMNGNPPIGYHVWHHINRTQAMLGTATVWHRRMLPLNGLAWAIQSIAKPVVDSPDNPGLPRPLIHRLKREWLPLSPKQLDDRFDALPYPAGIE